MEIYNNNHSHFALYYQLILITKNRVPIFNEKSIRSAIYRFKEISKNYLIELIEYSYEKDHIHIKFKAHAKSELSKFINAYKSASSRVLKRKYPEIENMLEDNGLWEKTYFLITEGIPDKDKIMDYLREKIKCSYCD